MTAKEIERQYATACLFIDIALMEDIISAGEWVGTTIALHKWRRTSLEMPDTARPIDIAKLDAAMALWGMSNVLPFPRRFDTLRAETVALQ